MMNARKEKHLKEIIGKVVTLAPNDENKAKDRTGLLPYFAQ